MTPQELLLLRSAAQQRLQRLLPPRPTRRDGAAWLCALAARGQRWARLPLDDLLPAWMLGLAPAARDALLHQRLRTYTAQLDERSGAAARIVPDYDGDAARLLPALAARDDVRMLTAAMDCGAIAWPKFALWVCARDRAARCVRFLLDDNWIDSAFDASSAVERVNLMCQLAHLATDGAANDCRGGLAAALRVLLANIAEAVQHTIAGDPQVYPNLECLIFKVAANGDVASLRLLAAYGLRANRWRLVTNAAQRGRGLAALRFAVEWDGGVERQQQDRRRRSSSSRFPCLRRWCPFGLSAEEYRVDYAHPAFTLRAAMMHAKELAQYSAELVISNCRGVACLRYVHRRSLEHNAAFPWHENICRLAAGGGELACLKYAHEHGCPWDALTPMYAAAHSDVACLRFALENGCPRDAEDIMSTLQSNSFALQPIKNEMIAMVATMCAAAKAAAIAAAK